jgi:hypothetical protein
VHGADPSSEECGERAEAGWSDRAAIHFVRVNPLDAFCARFVTYMSANRAR